MSFDRHLKERGFVEAKDLARGPNGRPLCRLCRTETVPPRRTFCSERCVNDWKIRSQPQYARRMVFERDRGVCGACGLDTEELKRLLYRIKTEKGNEPYRLLVRQFEGMYGYGFELGRHAWEADHILAVALGGGSCGLENLRTLCLPCHRQKTRLDRVKIFAASR